MEFDFLMNSQQIPFRNILGIVFGDLVMFKMLIGLYEKAPPDELSRKERFTAAGQIGYDYVKTSIDESVEM